MDHRTVTLSEGETLLRELLNSGTALAHDCDGKLALPITVTAEAAEFVALQLEQHPGCVGLRIAVTPAGCSGLRIAVDPPSLPYLQGATLRLAREGLATRLRFDNPNARQSCGCGESFGT